MLNNYFQFLRTTRIAKSTIIVLFFSMLGAGLVAQENKHLAGTSKSPTEHSKKGFKDGSNILGLHYLNQNICGLNYVEDDTLVETRSASAGFNAGGTGLPSAIKLRGLPTGCDSILKAYLYFSTSYNSGPANPATVSVTNPASSLFTYNGDTVGGSTTVGWGESGTACYRTDITTSISGNGVYAINITGAGCSGTEVDGLSLFVIYRDLSATYSGSLAIYDGEMSICTGSSFDYSATGFDVCANAPNAMAFGVMSDMQANVNGGINDQTFNGTSAAFSNNFWNYDTIRTTLTAGQTSTTYDTYTNNTSDCYSLTVAGLYWQNTTCVACVGSSGSLSLTSTTIDAGCGKSNGSATVIPTGGTSPYTYTWSNGSTNQTDSNLAAGSYTVHVIASGACVNSDSLVVIVADSSGPTITVLPINDSICPGSNVVLTASGASTYKWSPSTGLSATTGVSVTATPGSTITYTVVGTDALGCIGSTTTTVTIRTLPTITVAPLMDSVCQGDSVKITASGANSYTWSPIGGLSCTNCPSPMVSPGSTTTFTVTGTDSHGCTNTTTIDIKVNPLPVIIVSPAKDSICPGATVTLTASGGSTYTWSPATSLSCTNCASTLASPTSNQTWTVTGTNSFGCTNTATSKVSIKPIPYVAVVPPKDSICPGTSVSVVASAKGAVSYSWSPAAGLSCTTCANPNVSPAVTTTYTVTVSNGTCAHDTTVTIKVLPPAVAGITSPVEICVGKDTTLTATGGGTYKWSTGATTSSITVILSANTTYSVMVTSTNGCKDSASSAVLVDVPSFNVCCDTSIIKGATVVLSTNTSNVVAYVWTPGSGLNCYTCPIVSANPTVNTTYTIMGTDSNGCVTFRTVTVDILCSDFVVPNVFTPNGDGKNDVFLIDVTKYDSYNIEIFDRWGVKMYEANTTNAPWDGKTTAGQDAPDGVYYYIIKATCGGNDYDKKGFVQIIR